MAHDLFQLFNTPDGQLDCLDCRVIVAGPGLDDEFHPHRRTPVFDKLAILWRIGSQLSGRFRGRASARLIRTATRGQRKPQENKKKQLPFGRDPLPQIVGHGAAGYPELRSHGGNTALDGSCDATTNEQVRSNMSRGIRGRQDRRTFLQTGAAALAAGAAVTPGLSLARSAHVAGSDTVKIGLIGCGGRGTDAANQAMNTTSGSVNLVAMADLFEDRLNGAHEGNKVEHGDKVQVPDSQKFTGFDAFDRLLDTDVDLVILTTPPGFRPLHFEKAVAAGKHVFMEKPVAVDGPGVRRVLEANKIAREKNLIVQVGLQRRHEPAYIETIQRLQDGAIGDINFMRCYWNGEGVWVNARTPEQTELEYQCRNWYYFNWLCGDHIVEQHIHNLDVCNWLKNGYPVKAQGQGGRQVRIDKKYGQIFDHHFVEYTYADGSVMLSQCRHIPGCQTNVSEHAYGSEGYANISRGEIFDKEGKEIFRTEGARGGHQQEHHDMFRDYHAGVRPNEGDYGALSTLTSILGRMATYTGREITWEEALNSKLELCDIDGLKNLDSPAPVLPDAGGNYPIPVPGKSWDDVL
jgi:myo-inositol 2-dehydrogenase / D-chiro-inositol 1-dehydrogenase